MELQDLWDKDDLPNLPLLRNHFLGEGMLSAQDVTKICDKVIAILVDRPNMAKV